MSFVNANNYRDNVNDFWLRDCSSLEEKVFRVEKYRKQLYCQNPDKWHIFALLIGMIENDEGLSELFAINEQAHLWEARIIRKKHYAAPITVELARPTDVYPDLPKSYDTSGQAFPGLYFIGATYFVPTTKQPIYAVKIGSSYNEVGRRIRDYGTYNPFIYHEREMSLPYTLCPEAEEITCYNFLASLAVQKIEKITEWHIVDEKTYFYLCEHFKNKSFFAGVATGRIRAI